MSSATILTLANGKGIDLLDPHSEDIDWDAYAEQLAKEKRFNGATSNIEYSVAEHQCRGADAILEATGDHTLAAYFSLHDAHEAVLKDVTTPLKQALAETAAEKFGARAPTIMQAFALLEYRHDAAIHAAAGLPWPTPPMLRPLIKHWDLVMFVTEWRDLMGGILHPHWQPYAEIKPLLSGPIQPWPWRIAKAGLLRRWVQLLPELQRQLFPELQSNSHDPAENRKRIFDDR